MKKRLLIIEDDPIWAEVLARYAAAVGLTTRVVVSPAQAIEAVDDWSPHALCLDMLLAGETGMALLNELRSHDDLAALPVVVCSNVPLDAALLRPFGVRAVLDKSRMTPAEVRRVFAEAAA